MRKKRFIIVPGVIVLFLIALGLCVNSFLSSAPVLVVGDLAFDALYGSWKLRQKQVLLSLKLRRPLKMVRIAEDAGEDIAMFTVEAAAETPYCVIFPYRYFTTARRYSREYPEIPVGVFQGRYQDLQDQSGGNLVMLATDQKLDLYRAGRLAALLTLSGEDSPEEPPNVLVFQEEYLSADQRAAFKQGLEDESCPADPRYLGASSQYQGDIGVIYGVVSSFIEEPQGMGILFSWVDPTLTPSKIKIVFDDSPLSLAEEMVPLIVGPEQGEAKKITEIPSEIQILSRRLGEKGLLEKLKEAVKAEFP
jgi:hypothetical protein